MLNVLTELPTPYESDSNKLKYTKQKNWHSNVITPPHQPFKRHTAHSTICMCTRPASTLYLNLLS